MNMKHFFLIIVLGIAPTTAVGQDASCVLPSLQAQTGPYLSALEAELSTGVQMPKSPAAALARACQELGPNQLTRCAVARLTDQNESQSWSAAALCAQAWWTLGGTAELSRILEVTTRRLGYAPNDPETIGVRTDIACSVLGSCTLLDPVIRKRAETMCADGLERVAASMEGFLGVKNHSVTWFATSIATAVRGLGCADDARALGRAVAAAVAASLPALGTTMAPGVIEMMRRVHEATSVDSEATVGLLLMSARMYAHESTTKFDRGLLLRAMEAATKARALAKAPEALADIFEAQAYLNVVQCQWHGDSETAECLLRATQQALGSLNVAREVGGQTGVRIEVAADSLLSAYLRTNPHWRNDTKACSAVRQALTQTSADLTPLGAVTAFLARFYTTKDVSVSQIDDVVSRVEKSADFTGICELAPFLDMRSAVNTGCVPAGNCGGLLSRIGGLESECHAQTDLSVDEEVVKKKKKSKKNRK